MTKGRFIFYCALLLAGIYVCLTCYPRVLFSNHYEYRNISVHTRVPAAGPADALLARVYDVIMADDFPDPERKFEVYLTGGYAEYAFWAPFCLKAGSCVHPVTNKVFIASSDLDKNLAYGRDEAKKARILENVITHDLVLVQLKDKLGAMNYIALKDWLKEGYAEHIARETVDMDPALICGERNKNEPLVQFLESRLMMDMAKSEVPDTGYAGLVKSNYSYEVMRKRVMEKYCPSAN